MEVVGFDLLFPILISFLLIFLFVLFLFSPSLGNLVISVLSYIHIGGIYFYGSPPIVKSSFLPLLLSLIILL